MSGSRYRRQILDRASIQIPDVDETEFVWRPDCSCRDAPKNLPKKTFYPCLASDRGLLIEQASEKKDMNSPGAQSPHVRGEVILRQAKTKADKATLDVEIISNYEDVKIDVDFDTDGDTDHLKITTPQAVPFVKGADACVQIRVTVWIPHSVMVYVLNISTISLNISAQAGLILGAENFVNFSTVSGNIIFPDIEHDSVLEPYKVESPKFSYTTVSGEIRGWFPSYHSLKMYTVSGNITARIKNKDTLLKPELDLFLEVDSVSGELNINDGSSHDLATARNKVPARDYLAKISTASGNIEAGVFVGSSSAFNSASGKMRLELFPVLDRSWLDKSWRPLLRTTSTSGDQKVQIHEPLFVKFVNGAKPSKRPALVDDDSGKDDDPPVSLEMKRRRQKRGLAALKSSHDSISGAMHLVYPNSWEGKFKAKTMSARIDVYGKEAMIDKSRRCFVSGRKGDGSSTIQVDQMSGDINLLIGSK